MERRNFIKSSAIASAGILTSTGVLAKGMGFHSNSADALKIALIGCGGRGTAAVRAALAGPVPSELVAMSDLFLDRIDIHLNALSGKIEDKSKIKVTEETKFTGFQGYKDAIALADVVFIATPAVYKPLIFEEAIKQGKHVFMEKPVCVDSLGFHKILEVAQIAKEKGKFVAAGLQRRYSPGYQMMAQEIQDGAIGKVLTAECFWVGGPIGDLTRPRKESWTEMEFQNRHWRSFSWVAGGNIEEYHVHNLDVINWVLGEKHPESVLAMGGKSPEKNYSGSLGGFDSLVSNFKYKNGVSMHSYSRNLPNCTNKNGEYFYGTKGTAVISGDGVIRDNDGKEIFRVSKKDHGGFHGRHNDVQDKLMDSIYNNKEYYNEASYAAYSSMTGAFGRMSGWSGKGLKWDDAIQSKVELYDYNDATTMNSVPPILPDEFGNYPIPTPGKTIV